MIMRPLSGALALAAAVLVMLPAGRADARRASSPPIPIVVDGNAPSHPFPHFWEQMFGSGRAVLSLRDGYRRDMRQVKGVTDFRLVRFHAILDRDVGVYTIDPQGKAGLQLHVRRSDLRRLAAAGRAPVR